MGQVERTGGRWSSRGQVGTRPHATDSPGRRKSWAAGAAQNTSSPSWVVSLGDGTKARHGSSRKTSTGHSPRGEDEWRVLHQPYPFCCASGVLWLGTLAALLQRCHPGTGRLGIAKPERIDVDIRHPWRREVIFVINRLHRARGLACPAINAFMRIDVELPILSGVKMNTRHRADAHARLVHDINAGFRNHKGHAPHLPLALRCL